MVYRMSKANLNRWCLSFFLKSVMLDMVRKSAGREFHAPERHVASQHGDCIVIIDCMALLRSTAWYW